MTDRIERFKARQRQQAAIAKGPRLIELPEADLARQLSDISINPVLLEQSFTEADFTVDLHVSDDESDAVLKAYSDAFSQQRFDQLVGDSRREVLQAIAVPFGLGRVLAVYDKKGGNVDTINNARNEVYATDAAAKKYADLPAYDSTKFHGDKAYIAKNAKDTLDQNSGVLKDAYTNETFSQNKNQDPRNLDHTISANVIHTDRGRVLADADAPTLANADSNLNPTKKALNQSKGKKSATQFVEELQKNTQSRQEEMQRLSNKQELTPKDENRLRLLKQQEAIAQNPDLLLAKDKAAREAYEKKLSDAYYKSDKFKADLAKTSLKEGGKMAFQQAFGVMLIEFFSATFDELTDLYRNGRSHESLVPELRIRLERIAKRVANQWQAALAAGGGGFVAGVLANLVTTLINVFVTTGKRAVRMFREGFMSLLKALKTLLLPPKGLTLREAAHEAIKITCAGGVIIAGVALEEIIEKQMLMIPGLGALGAVLSAVIVGALTGLASTFVVYLVDKLDPLGVNRDRELIALNERSDQNLRQAMAENDRLLLVLENSLTT
ncbi:hypothetical protein [Pseudomonas sp. B21-021]|uniref:hypothetical protein n=1 Tax=Pseudomonas sp. B21-021 TaxID=2895476 RepID=UPI00215EFA76|nr:hypothetical protein [Pseudomonas sp. B21-021]UVM25553.1 hypothetical protein LOY31_19160 [Pseudomonas sp. B21-021]